MVRGKKIVVPSLKKIYNLSHENRYKIFKRVDFIIDTILSDIFYSKNVDEDTEFRNEIKSIILKKIYRAKLFPNFLKFAHNQVELVKNNISYDDIATYAFIEMSIKGFNVDNNIKQLFIDEVQDYSPIAIKIIREIFPSATLTIVGDYNQNLITTDKNLETLKDTFAPTKYFKLNNSYRSSNNIMKLANSIVNNKLQNSLSRDGSIPIAFKFNSLEEFCKEINKYMESLDQTQKTAIICKTRKEAELLSPYFPDFALVSNEKTTSPFFENNKILTTVFLSKLIDTSTLNLE